MTQIIVFDTGTGGKIFADHFRRAFPNNKITEVIDSANSPYGSRTPEEIQSLTEKALLPYLDNPDNLIVIACNTSTTNAIDYLRTTYANQQFVGVEPPIKAVYDHGQDNAKTIALVLATPATLKSLHYQRLKQKYAARITTYEPDCTNWAYLIDHNELTTEISEQTLAPFQKYQPTAIIPACTHYLSISEQHFTDLFPDAKIYSPLEPVTNRVRALLPPQ